MKKLFCVLLLLLVAFTGSASADEYQLTGGVFSGALTANILYTGTPSVGPEDVYVGPLNETITDDTFPTTAFVQTLYCDDIFDDYSSGGLFNLDTVTTVQGSTQIANEIIALLANAPQTTVAEQAALQAAIWSVENGVDFSVYDNGNGDYALFSALMATDIANVTGSTPLWVPGNNTLDEFTPIIGEANQSFVYALGTPVPEPGALAILAIGILMIGIIRWHRHPRANPVGWNQSLD